MNLESFKSKRFLVSKMTQVPCCQNDGSTVLFTSQKIHLFCNLQFKFIINQNGVSRHESESTLDFQLFINFTRSMKKLWFSKWHTSEFCHLRYRIPWQHCTLDQCILISVFVGYPLQNPFRTSAFRFPHFFEILVFFSLISFWKITL